MPLDKAASLEASLAELEVESSQEELAGHVGGQGQELAGHVGGQGQGLADCVKVTARKKPRKCTVV